MQEFTSNPPASPVSHSTIISALRSAGASCAPIDNPDAIATQVLPDLLAALISFWMSQETGRTLLLQIILLGFRFTLSIRR